MVERALGELELPFELGALQRPMRYAIAGGKRLRGTICLGDAEAELQRARRAAGA